MAQCTANKLNGVVQCAHAQQCISIVLCVYIGFNVKSDSAQTKSSLTKLYSTSMALFFHNAMHKGSGCNKLQIENISMCLCGF